jgi:hypothetical protein
VGLLSLGAVDAAFALFGIRRRNKSRYWRLLTLRTGQRRFSIRRALREAAFREEASGWVAVHSGNSVGRTIGKEVFEAFGKKAGGWFYPNGFVGLHHLC